MQSDTATRALLVLISLCLLVLVALGVRRGSSEGAEASAANAVPAAARFDVQSVALMRGPPLLLRSDTATGQVWKMGIGDAGAWKPIPEGSDGVPSPDGDQSGRYVIRAVNVWRSPPTLVRIDKLTGRIWRKGVGSRGTWVPVPNPPGEDVAAESHGEGS